MKKIVFLIIFIANSTNSAFEKFPEGIKYCSNKSCYIFWGSSATGFLGGSIGMSLLGKPLGIGATIGLSCLGAFTGLFLGGAGAFGALYYYHYRKDRNNIYLAISNNGRTNIEGVKRLLKEKPNIIYKVDKFRKSTPLEYSISHSESAREGMEQYQIANLLMDSDKTYKTIDKILVGLAKYPGPGNDKQANSIRAKYTNKILHEKLKELPMVLIDIILQYLPENRLSSELEIVVEA